MVLRGPSNSCYRKKIQLKTNSLLWDGESPGGSGFRTQRFRCQGQVSVPGQKTRIPQATWYKPTPTVTHPTPPRRQKRERARERMKPNHVLRLLVMSLWSHRVWTRPIALSFLAVAPLDLGHSLHECSLVFFCLSLPCNGVQVNHLCGAVREMVRGLPLVSGQFPGVPLLLGLTQ